MTVTYSSRHASGVVGPGGNRRPGVPPGITAGQDLR
jgi:hypothetical protein